MSRPQLAAVQKYWNWNSCTKNVVKNIFLWNVGSCNVWSLRKSNIQTIYIRLRLKKLFALEFLQRCPLAPRSQNIFNILLYQACGKWYFQSKIGQFGPIQASRTKLKNGVSLSTGLVEQNVKYVLWSGGQLASLVRGEAVLVFKTYSIEHELKHIILYFKFWLL